ncbi:LysR family transcriptional regulator [Parahaliea aestuarii]|uniref:LysR family transcriptional regulator n=1 Tax=Parahaliea aestuarii TaxID=1852021 RepID=A0A5C9A0D2_9GAMM|nr:LysR family transcriptional regulator [Parahaliea aestuarii]TXS93519.1 LysR family transcriptional regulator [Parahaliea aestuarii]
MHHNLETRQLLHLAALARHGNFHRAADSLFITQPALTKSIRKLEDQLQVLLFDRAPDTVRPTEHCLVLLEHAERIFDELDQAGNRLAELSSRPLSRIQIGCGPILGAWGLHKAVAEMHREHPEVRFNIVFGRAADLAPRLRDRSLHVLIGDTEPLEGDRDVIIEALPSEEFCFVCRTGHPLLKSSGAVEPDLLHYKLALPGLVGRAAPFLAQFMPEGWHLEEFIEQVVGVRSDNYHLLLDLIASTDYLSVGTESVFRRSIEEGKLQLLPVSFTRPIRSQPGIVRLRDRTLPGAIDTFCAELRRTAADLVKGDR